MIVGMNKYVNSADSEKSMEVLTINNSAVRKNQVERLAKIRASRDNAQAPFAQTGQRTSGPDA